MSGLALAIHGLSPNAAVLLLTAGTLLIYLELNRPGYILPGALGLLSFLLALDLLATDALAHRPLNPIALVLLLSAVALLSLDLLRPTPIPVAVAATLALVLGLRGLLSSPDRPLALSVAVGCGLAIGISTSLLTRIARRARANKGLD